MLFLNSLVESNPTIDFYKKLVKMRIIDDDACNELKTHYFSIWLYKNILYKYISFNKDEKLNDIKLQTMRNKELWFAPKHVFKKDDPSELQIRADISKIAGETHYREDIIAYTLDAITDKDDICCFSDRDGEYMWQNYANFHSGCCCVFEVDKTDDLWPVLYCNKYEIDFTEEIIAILNRTPESDTAFRKLAFIAPVLKDREKYQEEHEVRLLSQRTYESGEPPLFGKLEPNKKEAVNYLGRSHKYADYGLSLKRIVVGRNTPKHIVNEINAMPFDCIKYE